MAAERRIVRVDADGEVRAIRRSPKRATVLDVFDKLVAFPSLLSHPNLTLEVLLTSEDHIRAPEKVRSRSGQRTRDPGERRLHAILDRVVLAQPADVLDALPPLPREPFSTKELAALLGCSVMLAQRTAYCLRAMELIAPAGRRGTTPLHRRTHARARKNSRGAVDLVAGRPS